MHALLLAAALAAAPSAGLSLDLGGGATSPVVSLAELSFCGAYASGAATDSKKSIPITVSSAPGGTATCADGSTATAGANQLACTEEGCTLGLNILARFTSVFPRNWQLSLTASPATTWASASGRRVFTLGTQGDGSWAYLHGTAVGIFDAAGTQRTSAWSTAGTGERRFTVCASPSDLRLYVNRNPGAASTGGGTGMTLGTPLNFWLGSAGFSNASLDFPGKVRDVKLARGCNPSEPDPYPAAAQRTIGLLGDSVTAGSDATNPDSGYFTWANILTKHNFRVVAYAGVGGDQTAQMIARMEADVLSKSPEYAVVFGGANDIAGGVPAATIQANLQTICEAMLARGITPILSTIEVSKSYTEAMCTQRDLVNAWVAEFATTTHPEIIFSDMGSALARVDIPCWPDDAYVMDNIHPNRIGAGIIGASLAATLDSEISNPDRFIPSRPSWANMANSVGYAGWNGVGGGTNVNWDTGVLTGDVPLGWVASPGATAHATTSFIERAGGSAGSLGHWYQVQVTTGGEVVVTGKPFKGFIAGDSVYAKVEFESDDDWVGAVKFELQLRYRRANDSISVTTKDLTYGGGSIYNPRAGVLQTEPLPVPSDVTYLEVVVAAQMTSGTYRLGRVEVRRAP